ncbi:hypothetical protein [Neorhodopirellula pilleata]|uniref:Uncharacterized protein n=1 Tax=Neorhodopirellula pilleata TaxID=2714738 RepID=A0A5C5ZVW2_9BACT|nr:hypothetical protein [Neorhodopirellula pilleata]TWT91410.1 hypothetical protein Pla100_52600 [Neorhodopirellula pilleata]TWT91459.1 hypothetical protein Pla100_53090 [Neorhodopirellula pilleata]
MKQLAIKSVLGVVWVACLVFIDSGHGTPGPFDFVAFIVGSVSALSFCWVARNDSRAIGIDLVVITVVSVILASTADAQTMPPRPAKYQLVLVDEPPGVADWFRDHDGLLALAKRCDCSRLQSRSDLFRYRYAKSMPSGSSPPAIVFARPDSGVLYVATRDTLPTSADALYAELQASYRLAGEGPHASEISAQRGDRWRPGDRLRDTRDKLDTAGVAIDQLGEIVAQLRESTWLLNAIAAGLAVLIANALTSPRASRS